jgi:heavy metal sensor kinase
MKNWWQRRTIRFRLAVWYAIGGTILLTGFSVTLFFYVAGRMALPLDHQLRRDLAEIQKKLSVRPDNTLLWDERPIPQNTIWSSESPWFEVWDEHSELVGRYWPFAETRVQRVPLAPVAGRETLSVFNVAEDIRLRVLSVPFNVPGRNAQWMIRVMRIHEPVADALGALSLILIVATPVVLVLLVLTGYSLTRRWLLPLDQMAEEARGISAADLSRRLPVVNPHDELGRLAAVFNTTLDRLETSFDALDRFVADASHELRTPLTTQRSVGEVGLRRSRTVEEYREIIGSMLEESQRLQLLVQRLLELATAEGGTPNVHRSAIRLDEYVAACVNELGILAEYRQQRIVLENEPCVVETDPVIFRQALQNLVDNAIKYSPDQSLILVTVRNKDGVADISVADEGPGIDSENRARLAERFFRPDRGRNRDSGGHGLGLSITKAYMRVLGGSLEYEQRNPGGSIFRLRLPAAPSAM